jgi:nitric oxide reductase large subunit
VKKLYYAALAYTILGLAGGLFYRTFTHANNFTGDTQLAVVHTHFLVLGMVFFLGVMLFERAFKLSQSKLFNWFFWPYNVGLIWTAGFLTFNGMNTVLGNTTSAAVAGISGIGHILLTIGLILFFVCLRPFLVGTQEEPAVRQVMDTHRQVVNTQS